MEIKTTGILSPHNSYRNVPIDYILQVYCQAHALGKDSGWLVWLVGGHGLRVKLIGLDMDTLSVALELAKEFWHYVETDTPPPDVKTEPAQGLAKFVYEHDREALIEEYLQISEQRRALEKRETEIKQSLTELVGNSVLVAGRFEVLLKPVETTRLDTARLRQEHPELYAKYMSVSTQKRLVIRELNS